MKPEAAKSDLNNPAEASMMLRMSRANLARRRKRRQPPAWVQLGRKIFYRSEDLQRFVRDNVVKPTGEDAA
jgi:hypothetical protein